MSDNQSDGLKLTAFWHDDPELWFAQTEARFWTLKIEDDFTKFKYIISQLDKHCLALIRDVVLSPPAVNKYENLKSELLKQLKAFKIEKTKQILLSENIGNKKPSEFLQHLKDLAGPDVAEEYVKSVWSSLLPTNVQWVGSFLTCSSAEKIAHLADLAMNTPAIQSSETKSHSNNDAAKAVVNDEDDTKEIVERVDNLTKKVEDLTSTIEKSDKEGTSSNSTATSRTATTRTAATIKSASTHSVFSRNPTHSGNNSYPPLVICWYHATYGWFAEKCVQPCNFPVSHFNMR